MGPQVMLEVAWTSLCFDLKSWVLGLSLLDRVTEVVSRSSLQLKLPQQQEVQPTVNSRFALHL